jgi:hypothetical protein
MNMQALIDGLGAQWQRERAATQMTIGKLIEALKAMPVGAQVSNLRFPHSYRGYYSDLAFELESGTRSVGDLLGDCTDAMGKVFIGYKGGDFVMGALTPVWVANYGSCGERLMSFDESGQAITTPEDDE